MAENKTRKRRKKRKLLLPVMMVMAVLSVIGAGFGIYYILEESGNPLLTNQPDVQLPNFVGMTEAEAQQLEDFKFEVEYVYNSEYEKDVIVSQKPTAPRTVKRNSTVNLKVSKGVMSSEMPDIVNDPRQTAVNTLSEMDVNVYIKMEEQKDIPEGLVIRTEPAAGETVNSGDTVTIYIATDEIERTRTVPLLVGKHVDEARRLVSEAGLSIKVVNAVNDQPAGTVFWQNHGAGAQLPVGTQIEINVSVGPEG